MHAVILMKHQKDPSTRILKHANVLDKVNKSPWGSLNIMTPHDAYSVTVNVCTVTLVDISNEQKDYNTVIKRT